MTKSIFYVALCLAFGFTACIPKDSTQATEPEKLNIYLDVRDCTGQYRYGATVETIDGKYKHTLEQSVEGMTLSVPIGATSFTFRVKEERGNIISYRDTTINVSADDKVVTKKMIVE